MRTQSQCQTLSKVPLSWEQPLRFVNCLRLKGWQVPRENPPQRALKGAGGGWIPQHSQGSGYGSQFTVWEFENPARSATARQLLRAQPQKQKYVHMVSMCLSRETLILSCHLLVAKPELPRLARLALLDP